MRIYDAVGRLVARPSAGYAGGGERRITWDGHNLRGEPVPRGVYFYRIELRGGPGAAAAGGPASAPHVLHGKIVRE